MQQSQRASFNPALEHAIEVANRAGLPVLVGFGLKDDYAEAHLRHYRFMLEGLQEVAATLAVRRIKFVVRRGTPNEVAVALGENAALVVCDRGYLRHQKAWRAGVAGRVPCALLQVEGDVVVPLEVASDKAEAAARTLRPKLHRVWDEYLSPLRDASVRQSSLDLRIESDVDLSDVDAVLDGRDANSYANVAWAFGLHDRPWPERPVFGKVRSMNARGLERTFDMAAYLRAVDALVDAERR